METLVGFSLIAITLISCQEISHLVGPLGGGIVLLASWASVLIAGTN